MNIQFLRRNKMSPTGKSLLTILQNNNMPTLDLLVRESIQNSLDALLDGAVKAKIDFHSSSFSNVELCKHFDLIGNKLLHENRFSFEKPKFLAIRDYNTEGLTGPLVDDGIEEEGNLQRLVFQISRAQEGEGAGGSWGLGKTLYFRLGIGLVLFYSRVEVRAGEFEERMISILVEDQTSAVSILNKVDNHSMGIAWFGKNIDENEVIPITNEEEIQEILNVFSIKRYDSNTTGTTVIIPYVDEKRLLEETYTNESVNYKWELDVKSYLKHSIQKWYAPRINNPLYKFGAPLKVSVNDEAIKTLDPFFLVIQELYNASLCAMSKENLNSKFDSIKTEKIDVRNVVEGNIIGYFSSIRATKDDLDLWQYRNPFEILGVDKDDVNLAHSIIMYTRKPAMIVNYSIEQDWIKNNTTNNNEETYLIGIFVANTEAKMNRNLVEKETIIEEYFRKSEQADHTSWEDHNRLGKKLNVLTRINKQIRKKMEVYDTTQTNETQQERSLGISNRLGKIFLPAEGFGTSSTPKTMAHKNASNNLKKAGVCKLNLDDAQFYDDSIVVPFELLVNKQVKRVVVNLQASDENGSIVAPNDWEKSDIVGMPYPLSIKKLTINYYKVGKKEDNNYFVINDKLNELFQNEDYDIRVLRTKLNDVFYAIEFIFKEPINKLIKGEIEFSSNDRTISGIVNVLSKELFENE